MTMPRSEGTLAAVLGERVTLPSGRVLTADALEVREAVRMLTVLNRARGLVDAGDMQGAADAQVELLDWMVERFDLGGESLTPSEVFTLADHFLFRLNRLAPAMQATTSQGAHSGSTT